MNPKIVGENIKNFRVKKEMTQQELAEKIYVTDKAVSKWETGAGLPDTQLMAPLAIALDVSVDDLLTDMSKQTKFDKLMKWSKKKNLRIGLIAALLAVMLVYLGLDLSWQSFVEKNLHPFSYNETMESIPVWNRRVERNGRWWQRRFYDHNEAGYVFIYDISSPPRFTYRGSVMIVKQDRRNLDDVLTLNIYMSAREWKINLLLSEKTGENGSIIYGASVDKYGTPLGKHPLDSDEWYEKWLALYEERYDDIMTLFSELREIFGEDIFR